MVGKPNGHVLVLGDNDLAALAIVRSLGRSGLKVHLAVWEAKPITRHSRYVYRQRHLGNPSTHPDAFAQAVIETVQSTAFDLLVPVSDKSLVALMPFREQLNAHTRFAAPDVHGFEITHDKAQTLALAERLGIPIPPTVRVRDRQALDTVELPRTFPLVLKPIASVQRHQQARQNVRIVRSADELSQRLPAMLEHTPVLVQGFCPGYGVGLSILAQQGELVAAFQHQRIHEPPEGGASSYRKSVPLSQTLLDAARRFCQAICWTGPAMFEFKMDPSRNAAVLMEINGRFWGSLALAVQAGVDFPRLLYDMLVLGNVTPVFTYRTPYFVRHTLRDLPWFRANFRTPAGHPDLIKVPWPAVGREIGNIVLGREGYDLESLTDPWPALLAWHEAGREAVAHLRAKLTMAWYRRLAERRQRQIAALHPQVHERLNRLSSILFLCHGNIHRSALAEARLRQLLPQGAKIEIASAGFHPREGRATTALSQDVANTLGVDLSTHRSVQVTPDMLARFDLILVMEVKHLVALRCMSPGILERTCLLSAFDPEPHGLDIDDPYGKDREVFDAIYRRILACVDHLARRLPTASEVLPRQSGTGKERSESLVRVRT